MGAQKHTFFFHLISVDKRTTAAAATKKKKNSITEDGLSIIAVHSGAQ